MKVLLFLGSGASYASKLPSVEKITDNVLTGDWHEHTNMVFYPKNQDAFVSRLQSFLQLLKIYSDEYFLTTVSKKRAANYEDLFYLCYQIHDHEQSEILNPAIWPYIEQLRKEAIPLCTPLPPTNRKITLDDLATRSCDFIQCVVWHMIPCDKTPQGLSLISELSSERKIQSLDIITLNHDCLIEQQLLTSRIAFSDGFGEPKGDVRYYDPSLLSSDCQSIRLLKLHGSVNWFNLREEKSGITVDRFGIPMHQDVFHLKTEKDKLITWMGHAPILLCGSYNKLIDYNFGIFANLQALFYQSLYEHDIMVMSGYGWNDRGINGRILEWLTSSPSKQLFFLHETPQEIKETSKSAMWHMYDKEVMQGRLIPINKFLQNTSLSDLAFLK